MKSKIILENDIEKDSDSSDNEFQDIIYETKKYYLRKGKKMHIFNIEKRKDDLVIKTKNYEISLNENELSLLTRNIFNSLEEAYTYIIDIFENKKVCIKEIIDYESIQLIFKIYILNKEENVEMSLMYNREDVDLKLEKVINENKKYKKIINEMKNEFEILKEEFKKLKSMNKKIKKQIRESKANSKINIINSNNKKPENKKNKHFNEGLISNSKTIKLLNDFTNDSYAFLDLDNTFIVFKSIDNNLFLTYINNINSIVLYNLVKEQKITEIKKAHNKYITNIKHYLDEINNRDLILSISAEDNNLKIWNIRDWNCLVNIRKVNEMGSLNSACILNENNNNYILTSNDNENTIMNEEIEEEDISEPIKIFNFNGKLIKEVINSGFRTFFIDTYKDKKSYKNYIITGNINCVKSYDYNNNQVYKIYQDNLDYNAKSKGCHCSLIVKCIDGIIKIIDSCWDGNIRIWDFHSGDILKKIVVNNLESLQGMCLWDDRHLYIGNGKKIALVDLDVEKVIKYITGHKKEVLTIKKINLPNYGDCLLSQGLEDSQIKLLYFING